MNKRKKTPKRPFDSFPYHPFGKQNDAKKTKAGQWPGGGGKQGSLRSDTRKNQFLNHLGVDWTGNSSEKNKEV